MATNQFNQTTVSSISSTLQYVYYEFWESNGDPRVSKFPFMSGGPWPVVTIVIGYAYFVKVLGPNMMKSRLPFDLKRAMFVYNVLMSAFNGWMFYSICVHSNFGLITWRCTPSEPNEVNDIWQWRLRMGWLFTVSKYVDLIETVFFVLRKNFHQVSLLHVVHHSLIPINCWLGFKYIPSESVVFFPFVNSFVHCIMYFYYGVSTLGPRFRKYLWWKKYLTTLQIVQIAAIGLHCCYIASVPHCKVPKVLFAAGIPEAAFFVYLFARFFFKSYVLDPDECKVNRKVKELKAN